MGKFSFGLFCSALSFNPNGPGSIPSSVGLRDLLMVVYLCEFGCWSGSAMLPSASRKGCDTSYTASSVA